MAPQLYVTAYKEQFGAPGTVKRTELRPTSAHRRNNPQPRPDFLFPRSLQPSYRSPRLPPLPPVTPVDRHRPVLFPPVKHLSFRSPVATCPDNSTRSTYAGDAQHMPPVHPLSARARPPADGLQKLQGPAEPLDDTAAQQRGDLRNPKRKLDHPMRIHPLFVQQLKQNRGLQLRTRPQTSHPAAAPRRVPLTHYQRCRSNSSLDNSGCYSCFHVVKPYQAGHYIIHPEFVSECLY